MLGCVARRGDGLHFDAWETQAKAGPQRLVWKAGVGIFRQEDAGAGGAGGLDSTGDEVGVEVGLEDRRDFPAPVGGGPQVTPHAAVGVYESGHTLLEPDEVGAVTEPFMDELDDLHSASLLSHTIALWHLAS